jgi:competence protein ComEC
MSSRIIYCIIAGFVGGVFCASVAPLTLFHGIFLLCLGIFIGASLAVKKILHNRHGLLPLCTAVIIFSAGLGIMRYGISDIGDVMVPEYLLDQKIVLKGVILSEPDVREDTARYVVGSLHVVSEGNAFNTSVDALITVSTYPVFSYGDEIAAEGKMRLPRNSGEFDYRSFLAKEGIMYEMYHPRVTLVGSGKGNRLIAALLDTKQLFIDKIRFLIAEPEASFLAGILLGGKQSLGKEWQDYFVRAGVAHIVVLSGYNISIVGNGIQKITAFLPRGVSASFSVVGIILFAVMTGAGTTVVRASIMALLVIVAGSVHRQYNIVRALIVAAFLMVFHNPKIVVFDASFQLSFLATLGLVMLSEPLREKLIFVPLKYKLRETCASTVAAQIFVLPLLMYTMHNFSVVSLFANIAVLPLMPLTMLAGFVSIVFGFVHYVLAFPFSALTHLLLWYEMSIIKWMALLPFASLAVPSFSKIILLMSYVFIFLWTYRLRTKRPLKEKTGTARF